MPSLPFIGAQVLARLKAGQFVPLRKAQRQRPGDFSVNPQDRRSHLSPLVITKRCIRYDPRVFHDRADIILKLAHDLNDDGIKIVMLLGEQGMGKTSLVRGVIELMGAAEGRTSPQLLWFDANRYTDFEDITQFLIQYIVYLAGISQKQSVAAIQGTGDAYRQLTQLLDAMAHVPLLIVLDNMEYLVDSQLRLNSPPFKELLNFLLGFDNIKVVMMGERLPYTDLAPQALPQSLALNPQNAFAFSDKADSGSQIDELKLYGLSEPNMAQWLSEKSGNAISEPQLHQLYELTRGYPWLIKTMLYLNQKSNVPFQKLLEHLTDDTETSQPPDHEAIPVVTPVESIATLIYQDLEPIHRMVAQLMVLVRHPVDVPTLQGMIPACFLGETQEHVADALARIEQSVLRPVLKINYPPQEVLQHLQSQQAKLATGEPVEEFIPSYDLYHAFKKIVYRQMPAFERIRLHDALQAYYLDEKNQPPEYRTTRLKTKALVMEANFHLNMAQRRAGASSGQPESAPVNWQAQAYQANLDQHQVQPLQPRYSLADYRRMGIPGEIEMLADNPAVPHTDVIPVPVSEGSGDSPDIPWENLLTEEEKRLLGLDDADFERSPVDTATTVSIVPDTTPIWVDSHEKSEPSKSEFSETVEDSRLKAIQHALTLAVEARDKLALIQQLMALAAYWSEHKRFERAEECLQKAASLATQDAALPQLTMAEIQFHRGLLHERQYQITGAENAFQQAYRLLEPVLFSIENQPDFSGQALASRISHHMANLYLMRDALPEAIQWQIKANHHGELACQAAPSESASEQTMRLKKQLAEGYFQQGRLFDELGQLEPAIAAYKQSILQNQKQDPSAAAAAMSNIGQLYSELGDFEQAIDWLGQALNHDKQSRDIVAICETLETMAVIQEQWAEALEDDAFASQHFQKAEAILQDALKQLDASRQNETSLAVLRANIFLKLGNLSARLQRVPQALHYYRQAQSVGKDALSESSKTYLSECIARLNGFAQ